MGFVGYLERQERAADVKINLAKRAAIGKGAPGFPTGVADE